MSTHDEDGPLVGAFHDYTRCPVPLPNAPVDQMAGSLEGFFRWEGLTLFGRAAGVRANATADGVLPEVGADSAGMQAEPPRFPLDPSTVADNLRFERYLDNRLDGEGTGRGLKGALRHGYYALRPLLPVGVRKHLQRWALRDWRHLSFPRWPVDTTVDDLMKVVFGRLLDVHGADRLPFVWFWPEGHTACAIMTHDVETAAGRDYSPVLMEMEARHGIRSSFEIVPEERYDVPRSYLDGIRSAGCEVCVHGLNHDGHLFLNEAVFRERAPKINAYARQYGATGFRSPVMYRRVDWFDAFEFSYDMSLPNVAHLDPQRGGCCTVMPYFIGDIVELPLTTIQDYPLYEILGLYSMDLWKAQCEILLGCNGLISFIIHPDYTLSARARHLYGELLIYLTSLRDDHRVWMALPREVDRWWRQRRQLKLERSGPSWRIAGEGAERARLAFACRDGDRVAYRLA
jgi:hypothetical protein